MLATGASSQIINIAFLILLASLLFTLSFAIETLLRLSCDLKRL